jgi:aryl-alcohol dehydrogenase-like predicted oxidoreductase
MPTMKYGAIEGVSRPVSRLIQGTLRLGRLTEDDAFALLDAVYAEGARAFDTAPVYGAGRAEAVLGAWIRARGVRQSVVIIDKGAHPDAEVQRVNPREITADVTRSVALLGGGSIDLYLLHRDDPAVPVDELVDCLNERRRAGQIDAFGASNWTHARIAEANAYARRSNQLGFVASSPELNLCEPVRTWPGCLSIGGASGAEARAWYRESRLALLAWSPVAGGFLGGAFTRESCRVPESPQARRIAEFYGSEENFARLERLRELAADKKMAVACAALGYVASQSLDVFATVGCDSVEQFRECMLGLDVRLDAGESHWLETGRSLPGGTESRHHR